MSTRNKLIYRKGNKLMGVVFFFVLEERDIKGEQKYIFTIVFNRDGLREINGVYLKWIK